MDSPEVLQLRQDIDETFCKELTPDNVRYFADELIEDLLSIRNRATEHFISNIAVQSYLNEQTLEDDAFSTLKLPCINELLDSAAKIAHELPVIDLIIKNCDVEQSVFVPPDDNTQAQIVHGKKNREIITSERTKITLLILAKDFGVDLADESSFKLKQGIVDPKMIREYPYNVAIAHNLQRAILVCDQVGNITYVLNTEITKENGETIDVFLNMTKTEIDDYLLKCPEAGQRVIDSTHYIANLREAIRYPHQASKKIDPSNETEDKCSELDINQSITTSEVQKKLHIHGNTLNKILRDLGVSKSHQKINNRTLATIPSSSYEAIRQHPIAATPHAEDYDAVSLEKLHKQLGVGRPVLDEICRELNIQIGEYKHGLKLKRGVGILSSDLNQILNHPLTKYAKMDDAHVSIYEYAKNQGTTVAVIKKELEDLNIRISEVRYNNHISQVFSKEHESELRSKLNSDVPVSGDYSAISFREASELFEVSQMKLEKVVQELGIQTGYYRFGTKTSPGLLSDDLKILESHPELGLPKAGEDIIKINDVLDKLCVSRSTLFEAAENNNIPIRTYKFGKTRGYGFNKEELAILSQDLKLATPLAVDYEVVSLNIARYALSTTREETLRQIKKHKIQTGQFKFGPNYEIGILKTDLDKLRDLKH